MQTIPKFPSILPAPGAPGGMFVVAVTGHRELDPPAAVFVTRACHDLLSQLQVRYPGCIRAISGLAIGTDTIFADAALALGIPLEAVIAADDLIEDFPSGPDRERFLRICGQSCTVHRLPFSRRCEAAYLALGQHLVNSCNLLVAAWNGRPAMGSGGTGDVVAYARMRARPLIHLNTQTATMSYASTLASLRW